MLQEVENIALKTHLKCVTVRYFYVYQEKMNLTLLCWTLLHCIIYMSSFHFTYTYTYVLQELFFMDCFLNVLDVLHCWFLDYLNIWLLCGMTWTVSNHLVLKTLICELWCSFLNEHFIVGASNEPYESCACSRLKTKDSTILSRCTVWN